jgi:hypothetical protein
VYKCHEAIYLSLIIRIIVLLVCHDLFHYEFAKGYDKIEISSFKTVLGTG